MAGLGTAGVPALGQPGCYDFTGYLSLLQNIGSVLFVSVFLCGSSFWFFPFTSLLLIPTGKKKVAAMVVVGLPSLGHRRRDLAAQAPELLA